MDQLVATLEELDRDEAVRCIVLGGNERAFAAGADVGELAAGTPVSLYRERRIDVLAKAWRGVPILRVSFQGYNDENDLDALLSALPELL